MPETYVKFSASDWVKLIVTIATACVAMVAFVYGMQASQADMINTLDRQWQQRIATITKEIRLEIKEVKNSIPPEWLVNMVRDNKKELAELRRLLINGNGGDK